MRASTSVLLMLTCSIRIAVFAPNNCHEWYSNKEKLMQWEERSLLAHSPLWQSCLWGHTVSQIKSHVAQMKLSIHDTTLFPQNFLLCKQYIIWGFIKFVMLFGIKLTYQIRSALQCSPLHYEPMRWAHCNEQTWYSRACIIPYRDCKLRQLLSVVSLRGKVTLPWTECFKL